MCWCNSNIRTPCCGGLCCYPEPEQLKATNIPTPHLRFKRQNTGEGRSILQQKVLVTRGSSVFYEWWDVEAVPPNAPDTEEFTGE